MRIEEEIKLDYNDVLLRPKRSTLKSRKDVELEREYIFKWSGLKFKGIPIIASNMDGVGTFEMSHSLSKFKMLTCIVKYYNLLDWKKYNYSREYSIVSTGISYEDYYNAKEVLHYNNINWICIDVANGYSEQFVDFCKSVRKEYPLNIIIAGNVVTADMTQELIMNGVDVVKVGIGSGSVCTTRLKTGVGYPQLSAVIECADAAHGLGAHIIADGGCNSPGDVVKAFAAGSDFVMLGGMLAGHKEGGQPEGDYVKFYGMSSKDAQNVHNGGLAEYRSSEGKTVEIKYRGLVEDTIKDILGGLRSACTYVGARRLKDLGKCATFIRVNRQYNSIFG